MTLYLKMRHPYMTLQLFWYFLTKSQSFTENSVLKKRALQYDSLIKIEVMHRQGI